MSGWFWLIGATVGSIGAMIFLGTAARTIQDGEQRLATLENTLRAVRERRRQALGDDGLPTSAAASASSDAQDATRAA